MKILNITKDCILADRVFLADSFLARIKGLLGFKSLDVGQAMIIRPCNSVHTFFMHFPIDVLFVDKNNRVAKIIKRMKPFRVSLMCTRSKSVIELPAGIINSSNTSTGDMLEIQ
ncbi:MAG: DUF192 domain-containing protein [Candidatus Omnitrophica bacterium]|nr:DUF192 domain-containing protein [Candidatus Omnitrophota bacterium]